MSITAKKSKHGRLYPNLDTIVNTGLVRKGAHDGRTNAYTLTQRGHQDIMTRRKWEDQYVDSLSSPPSS